MHSMLPRVRAGAFSVVLIAFFLPFVTVSCPGMQVTFSGVQLAMGTTFQDPRNPNDVQRLDGEPLAQGAALSALVGLLLAFLPARTGRIASAVAGGLGAALLLLFKNKLDHDVVAQGMGVLVLNYEPGYWLAFLVLGGIVLLAAFARGPSRPGSA